MKTIHSNDIQDDHILVDVRTPGEFHSERIPNSVNMPLDGLESEAESLTNHSNIVLVCASGNRASRACEILKDKEIDALILEQGLKGWKASNRQVERQSGGTISLERQVRIVAGALVTTGSALALTVDPNWAFLSGFVGCGLVFAGVTDTCGMAMMLAKLPFNRK